MPFRRSLTGILLPFFLVALPGGALAASFPDTEGTVYEAAFGELREKGVIQGYADGLARPEAALNRAEALKVILGLDRATKDRVDWYRQHLPAMPLFWDMDQSQWYAPYVEAAFEKSLLTGFPDGSLRPGQMLRVEEAVVLLMRTIGEGTGIGSDAILSPYIENQSQRWYTAALNGAIRRNLIMHQGRLRLGTAITRGQFFDMVYRLSVVRTPASPPSRERNRSSRRRFPPPPSRTSFRRHDRPKRLRLRSPTPLKSTLPFPFPLSAFLT